MAWSVMLCVLAPVPQADPQKLVHIAGRVWAAIPERASRADLTHCDPLKDNPDVVRNGMERDNLFAISI